MSNSVAPVVNAAADIKRRHPRVTKFAAVAAVAGVLGSAGFTVGSAAVAQAAAKPATGHSGAAVQLDAFQAGAVGATATAFSHSAAHQAAQPAVNIAKRAVHKATTKPAPAKHAATKAATHQAAPAAPAKPYRMYDSVTPSSLPAGAPAAAYTDGAYAASYNQVANHKSVLWIDTNGSNRGATVLDVEPGDATPAGAALWVQQRLTAHPHSVAIVYTMMSDWQQVKAHIAHLPKAQQDNVRYWIADPTGVNHMVPGADATQWYWGTNIDISTANPSLTQAG
jgi:hypothetical protein